MEKKNCFVLNNQLFDYKKQAFTRLSKMVKYGICEDPENYSYRYIKPFKVADQKLVICELANCILED